MKRKNLRLLGLVTMVSQISFFIFIALDVEGVFLTIVGITHAVSAFLSGLHLYQTNEK